MDQTHPTESFWNQGMEIPHVATFRGTLDVDVAIVGAGITGLTAAALLKSHGLSVAVFERSTFGKHGTTHRTTAHLTVALDQSYRDLIRKFGERTTALAIHASAAAINLTQQLAQVIGFDNEFKRVDGFYYTENHHDVEEIEDDYEVARKLGLDVALVHEVPLPFPTQLGYRIAHQAQIHPMKHLIGLLRYINDDGERVFHQSAVRDCEDGVPCRLKLDDGTVTARDVILATHTPMGVWPTLQTRLSPYLSYVITARVNESIPAALFWDNADPYNYIRRASPDSGSVLIIGGADTRTGDERETSKAFESLEYYAQDRFEVQSIEQRWSSQFFEPADGLPYIGRGPRQKHVYVATGYSGTGMTYGTAAAMLLTDLILGKKNEWEDAFNPRRAKPIASAKHVAKDVGATVRGLVTDRIKKTDKDIDDIGVNDGAVISVEGQRVAAYRDGHGELHARSAVCTHMGCMLEWNNSEKTWDCKCHGSMFRPDTGEPIQGPATTPLAESPIQAVARQNQSATH